MNTTHAALEALKDYQAAPQSQASAAADRLANTLRELLREMAGRDVALAERLNKELPEHKVSRLGVLEKPLTRQQIARQAQHNNGYITGLIAVSLSELPGDGQDGMEAWLDLISERLTGRITLMDLSWTVRGHLDGNSLLMEVTGDASELLGELDQEDEEAEESGEQNTKEKAIAEPPAGEEDPDAEDQDPPVTYQVRTNCEYSIEVEARSEKEALEKAAKVDLADWGQAWAPWETEVQ